MLQFEITIIYTYNFNQNQTNFIKNTFMIKLIL